MTSSRSSLPGSQVCGQEGASPRRKPRPLSHSAPPPAGVPTSSPGSEARLTSPYTLLTADRPRGALTRLQQGSQWTGTLGCLASFRTDLRAPHTSLLKATLCPASAVPYGPEEPSQSQYSGIGGRGSPRPLQPESMLWSPLRADSAAFPGQGFSAPEQGGLHILEVMGNVPHLVAAAKKQHFCVITKTKTRRKSDKSCIGVV